MAPTPAPAVEAARAHTRTATPLSILPYRQLPVHSPVPGAILPRLWRQTFGSDPDPRLELNAQLKARYAAHGCTLTASGTHALQLALRFAGTLRADLPVLLPAYTCFEVATAAVGAGVRVALYDLDPDTLEPDWDGVRRAAAEGAAAVVVAPLFGLPLDWREAGTVAENLGALLIADAAQAHGSLWNQRPVATRGDLTILSFGRGKGWTGGGGGALLWRGRAADESRDVFAVENTRDSAGREARASVVLAAQWLLGRPSLYGLPTAIPALGLGQTIYHEPTPPSPMARTAAAMLLASEEGAAAEVSYRRNNARRYATALDSADQPHAVIGRHFDDTSGALRFPVRVPGGWSVVRQSEAPRMGAAPGYPSTLADIPALRPLRLGRAVPLPGAELLARDLFTLPTHSLVSHSEADRLAGIVRTLFASGSRSQSQR